jgi:hypothetical protein
MRSDLNHGAASSPWAPPAALESLGANMLEPFGALGLVA